MSEPMRAGNSVLQVVTLRGHSASLPWVVTQGRNSGSSQSALRAQHQVTNSQPSCFLAFCINGGGSDVAS